MHFDGDLFRKQPGDSRAVFRNKKMQASSSGCRSISQTTLETPDASNGNFVETSSKRKRSFSNLSSDSSPTPKLEVIFPRGKRETQIKATDSYIKYLKELIAVSTNAEKIAKLKQTLEEALTKILELQSELMEEV